MQAYEGYFENGRFYPTGKTTHIPERRRVIITILDEPPTRLSNHSNKSGEQKLRAAWIKELDEAIDLSSNEELREEFFTRSTFMREPIILTDEE